MQHTLSYLNTLVQETHKSETEILTLAFQVGVLTLWRDWLLNRYLHQQLSRQETIELVGRDWVELAERQHEAMLEDFSWALSN